MGARFDLEAGALRRQRFTCLPNCGFCCLCEPGLSETERARFAERPEVVRSDGEALRIVGDAGPCQLLDASRGCSAYDLRPRGCRSFPFHTTFLWRAQVQVNRGCPGTWQSDAPPAREAFDPGEALPPPDELIEAQAHGREAWEGFRAAARATGTYVAPEDVHARLVDCLPLLLDRQGLAAGIALADAGLPVTEARLREGVGAVPELVLTRALEGLASATFQQEDPRRLPLWVQRSGDAFQWFAFRLDGAQLIKCTILADGRLEPSAAVPLHPVPLLPREPAAEEVFRIHAQTIVDRDLLLGLAAFMLDRLGYAEPWASSALRELCMALGDLWLRAGLMARFAGRDRITREDMEAGVAFFDMGFLNAPTLGVSL